MPKKPPTQATTTPDLSTLCGRFSLPNPPKKAPSARYKPQAARAAVSARRIFRLSLGACGGSGLSGPKSVIDAAGSVREIAASSSQHLCCHTDGSPSRLCQHFDGRTREICEKSVIYSVAHDLASALQFP